jgi:hypothetical protein
MICGKGMSEGLALFRQNPKGEMGIWACRAHSLEAIDPVVSEIVVAIENKQP